MSKIHTPHMTGFLHWTAPQPVVWYLLEAYLLSWRWQDSPLTIFNYVKVFFCHAHQNSWNRFHAWAQSLQKSLIQVTLFQCIFSFQPPPFPMVWRTLRSSICQPLVSRERKGLGCSSPPSSAGSVLSQEPCRCLVIRHSHLPAWAEGIRFPRYHHSMSPVIWLLNTCTCPSLASPVYRACTSSHSLSCFIYGYRWLTC